MKRRWVFARLLVRAVLAREITASAAFRIYRRVDFSAGGAS